MEMELLTRQSAKYMLTRQHSLVRPPFSPYFSKLNFKLQHDCQFTGKQTAMCNQPNFNRPRIVIFFSGILILR